MFVLVIVDDDNDATADAAAAAALATVTVTVNLSHTLRLQFLHFRSHASCVGSVYIALANSTPYFYMYRQRLYVL